MALQVIEHRVQQGVHTTEDERALMAMRQAQVCAKSPDRLGGLMRTSTLRAAGARASWARHACVRTHSVMDVWFCANAAFVNAAGLAVAVAV